MAAKVCYNCGLTTNSDNELIVDTNEAVWPFTGDCSYTSGSPVYCGEDGALRTSPPGAIRSVNVDRNRSYSSEEIPDEETAFGFRAADGGVSYTLTNPSSCYSAVVDITEIWDFDLRPSVGCRVRINAQLPYGQIWDFTNRGTATIIDMGWNTPVRRNFILAPGASQVITPSIGLRATGGGGAVLNKVQYTASGTITALPNVSAFSA